MQVNVTVLHTRARTNNQSSRCTAAASRQMALDIKAASAHVAGAGRAPIQVGGSEKQQVEHVLSHPHPHVSSFP